MMRYLVLTLLLLLQACSVTNSDARNFIKMISIEDKSIHSTILLTIDSENLITTSLDSEKLYKLHASKQDIKDIVTNIARLYGFNMVAENKAEFIMKLITAKPDGGACVEGMGKVAKGISFSASILTLGISPATSSHCFEVMAELYYVANGEEELVGEFSSNEGRVEVFAGANEVDNYQLTVTRHDEEKAIETSFASLFQSIITLEIFK